MKIADIIVILCMSLCISLALSSTKYVIGRGSGGTEVNINIERITTNTWDDYSPSLFVDSCGRVHIAWAGGTWQYDMSIYYAYKSDAGWITEVLPKPPGSVVNDQPSLFVDSVGRPHIAWISNPYPYGGPGNRGDQWWGWDVWYAVKDSGIWTLEQVTHWGSENQHVRLFLDTSDNPHIAWDARYYNGLWGVHYATKIGNTWNIETLDNQDDAFPSLFVDSNGNPHLLWSHLHNDVPHSTTGYAVKVGGSWISETMQVPKGVGERELFVDHLGVLHIATTGLSRYGYNELWSRVKTDGTWSAELLRDSSTMNLYQSIFLDSSGTTYIGFQGNTLAGQLTDIYLAMKEGGTWNYIKVSDTTTDNWFPSFYLDSQNNCHFAWFSPYIGEGAEIYYAKVSFQPVQIDNTPPTISLSFPSPDGNNGWFKSSPVTGTVTVTDPSNVASISCTGATLGTITGIDTPTASAPLTVSGDGTYSISVTATDGVGNSGAAPGSINTATVKIDTTPPIITISKPIAGDYILNAIVLADWSAVDALSGINFAVGTIPSGAAIDTSSVGMKPFMVSAGDKSGNTATTSISYYVRYSYVAGRKILPPLEQVSSPSGLTKAYKLGSTLPIKFQLFDANGAPIGTAKATLTLNMVSNGVDLTDPVTVLDSGSSNDNGNTFRYDPVGQQYIFNLSTKNLQQGTYKITVSLDDGTSIITFFELRK